MRLLTPRRSTSNRLNIFLSSTLSFQYRRHFQGFTMKKSVISIAVVTGLLTGCGTFNLGYVQSQAGRTAEQQQLDTLTCKDTARLAAESGDRQVGNFLLGMTIVGAPIAYELDRSKQREVFKECMQGKGYSITSDQVPNTSSSTTKDTPQNLLAVTNAKIDLPSGWDQKDLSDAMKASGTVFYRLNTSIDSGLMLFTRKRVDTPDVSAYVKSRIAQQSNNLDNSITKDISKTTINGLPIWQVEVTGNLKTDTKIPITYLLTFFESADEVVLINIWTSPANFGYQKESYQQILRTISGISPRFPISSPSL